MAPGGRTIYVGDRQNSVVRRIQINLNSVDTVVGRVKACPEGAECKKLMGLSFGVALDTNKNLYYVDNGNVIIGKVNLTTMDINQSFSGRGVNGSVDGAASQCQYSSARFLKYFNGYLYVAESATGLVRQIDMEG